MWKLPTLKKIKTFSEDIFLELSFLIDLLNSFAQKLSLLIVSTLESWNMVLDWMISFEIYL